MTENNTTVAECITDCVEAASSSIFDDIKVVLVAVGVLLGIAAWAIQKYKTINADGKITFDELLDTIDEAEEQVDIAEEQVKIIEKTLAKHNVAELKAMLKEKGLPVGGKKADLIARLESNE